MRVNSLFYLLCFWQETCCKTIFSISIAGCMQCTGLNMKCTPDNSATVGGCGIFRGGDLVDENRSPGVSLKA